MEVVALTSPEIISDDDTTGIGRSYLCIFCKRGFCTAQALGGHMNIHRKHRGKVTKQTKPTAEYSCGAGDGFLYQYYTPYVNYPDPVSFSDRHQALRKYNMKSRSMPRELWLLGDDHVRREGMGGRREMRSEMDEEEGIMDLELRLGIQPSPSS